LKTSNLIPPEYLCLISNPALKTMKSESESEGEKGRRARKRKSDEVV
jgi:hypothetical protein